MIRPDDTDIVVLFNVLGIPKVHYHALRAVRCASAASVSHIVLWADLHPSSVRVVAVFAVMVETGAQVDAHRHAASLDLEGRLILLGPCLISEAFRALVRSARALLFAIL